MPDNVIRAFLDKLEAQRQHDEQAYQTPPEPPPREDPGAYYHLQWAPSQLKPLPAPAPLEQVRIGIGHAIHNYVKSHDERLLLVRVPPGTGKTTAAVNVAQDLARDRRILYAGPRHDFFADICLTQGCRYKQWYEWLPYAHRNEQDEPDMCRYADQMVAWLNRGYPALHFCKSLCNTDKWMRQCPYRLQGKRKEPIIFGMHEHLITGMAISNYALAFCDEMPLKAFLKRTHIPAADVPVPGTMGAAKELLNRLVYLTQWADQPVYGKTLMLHIGDILADVYAEIEVLGESLPLAPRIVDPNEAYDAAYWYLQSLLLLLSPEYECWRNGWESWLSRVRVSKRGILMLSRHQARDEWRKDKPLVCLDATGSAAMYRRIFGREVIEYAPQVERPGRVFQVVGRLNGIGSVLVSTQNGKKKILSKKGKEMLGVADLIAAQYEGRKVAVTFKHAEPQFMDAFGEGQVRHFGDIRGTNDLESANVLIVAGGFCPNVGGVYDLAAALNPERMESFVRVVEGKTEPPWSRRLCEYRMRDNEGLAPWRNVSGFWRDPDLRIVLEEFRRNEIVQALHRCRPNLQASDVWLLTSIPTGEPLDAIYEDASDLDFTPERRQIEKVTRRGKAYKATEGISWIAWLKLWRWLNRQWKAGVDYLTKEDLAVQAGVKPSTVAAQKWIEYLAEFTKSADRKWGILLLKIKPSDRQRTRVLAPIKE